MARHFVAVALLFLLVVVGFVSAETPSSTAPTASSDAAIAESTSPSTAPDADSVGNTDGGDDDDAAPIGSAAANDYDFPPQASQVSPVPSGSSSAEGPASHNDASTVKVTFAAASVAAAAMACVFVF